MRYSKSVFMVGVHGFRLSRWRARPERRSLHLLGETGAERMRRIDPEDLELLGEERQLLECERERAVVGMAFDVGVELRGEEIALDHVALELGHVDAVGGKTAERLVERGRNVAHPEQERGD